MSVSFLPPMNYPGTIFGQQNYGNPYDAQAQSQFQAIMRRQQMEADREYELRKQSAERQREQIAVSQGQAKATEWYNRQMIGITRDRLQQEMTIHTQNLAETQRQFNVSQSGYLDSGKPTLGREQFQDQSLMGWTGKAVELASKPRDWVNYARYSRGVSGNVGNIPGLAWTQGGSMGNVSADPNQAAHPTNSLGSVFGDLGVGTPNPTAQQAMSMIPGAGGGVSTAGGLNAQQQQLYATANELASNPQGAAYGWLEGQDPTMVDLLRGAAEAQGHDWPTVLARYGRSRWGAGSGSARAA